jgi:hypothetical protein
MGKRHARKLHFQYLKDLVLWVENKVWNDLQTGFLDYLHVLGTTRLVQYVPSPDDVALYISKHHPYAPYHIMSWRNEMFRVDVRAR